MVLPLATQAFNFLYIWRCLRDPRPVRDVPVGEAGRVNVIVSVFVHGLVELGGCEGTGSMGAGSVGVGSVGAGSDVTG